MPMAARSDVSGHLTLSRRRMLQLTAAAGALSLGPKFLSRVAAATPATVLPPYGFLTADELAKFPYAKEALQTLAIRQKDPVARAKLDAIVKSIGLKRGDQPKKPTYNELMQQGIPH